MSASSFRIEDDFEAPIRYKAAKSISDFFDVSLGACGGGALEAYTKSTHTKAEGTEFQKAVMSLITGWAILESTRHAKKQRGRGEVHGRILHAPIASECGAQHSPHLDEEPEVAASTRVQTQ
eukprot:jgi/Tetstr1/459224/TSEL_000034.t1